MSYTQLLVLVVVLAKGFAEQCLSRDYGKGGTVCVCNANHCDTITLEKPQPGNNAVVYTSNKDGLRFQKKVQKLSSNLKDHEDQIIIGNQTYQKIIGFGGAFTDSTGINILKMDKVLQEKILRAYFSKNGLEYSVGRVPIGGTDFSTRAYSYVSETVDPQLKSFKLQPEDFKYKVHDGRGRVHQGLGKGRQLQLLMECAYQGLKIPLIKRAYGYSKNLKLFSSAWTAPKWMKENGKYTGPLSFLKEEYYQQWADYHVKFLDAYAEHNVTFWGMTTGNEPFSGIIKLPVPSVAWVAPSQRQWVQNNLGPTIRKSAHSKIHLMALDDQIFLLPLYMEIMFKSKKVEQYIDGIAIHWYLQGLSPSLSLSETHEKFPQKFILATEASIGSQSPIKVCLGCWNRGEEYIGRIIYYIENFATGFLDWNMVLDLDGGPSCYKNFLDAPVIVNATAGEFYKQPMFYAMGHFSKFVPPGSRRIETEPSSKDISVVGFKRPDGIIALVILNKSSSNRNLTIKKLGDKKKINLAISKKSFTTILI